MPASPQTDFPLPANLPRPLDDGAAAHLRGMRMPEISLQSTGGRLIRLSELPAGRTVFYCYPMTGVPGEALPAGWDDIPGARGCTPQTCGYRDHFAEFTSMGVEVFGVSTQTAEYQSEMATRLHLPFEILSDAGFALCDALRLPTFEVEGKRLLKRTTLLVRNGEIEHVWYPVFPPNESARDVLSWLVRNPLRP